MSFFFASISSLGTFGGILFKGVVTIVSCTESTNLFKSGLGAVGGKLDFFSLIRGASFMDHHLEHY